jgi:sulfur carrier protein
MISLTVNGETRNFERAINIADLIESLDLSGRRYAVERNGSVVPRSRFAEETLAQGDIVEIVVAVGGG